MNARALIVSLIAAAAFALSSPALPARAAPHDAGITSATQGACGALACTPGSSITARSVVGGIITLHIHAEADLGLEWVQLLARNPDSPFFYCIEQWTPGGDRTVDVDYTWNTSFWTDPRLGCTVHCSSCIHNARHHHGAPTVDTDYALEVVAREQGRDVSGVADSKSATFDLTLQNAPAPPAWSNDPTVSTSGGSPAVTLQWSPSATEQAVPPEPAEPPADVVEYRFLRVDPDGSRHAFAVSATQPDAQGCTKIGTIAYRCVDTAFAAPYGGTYRYAVATVRAGAKGPRCELSSARCVVGALSATRSVTIAGVPAPTARASGSAVVTPGATSSGEPAPAVADPNGLGGPAAVALTPAAATRSGAVVGVGAVLLLAAVGTSAWLRLRAARR